MPETPSNAEGVADVFERRYEFAERYYGDESLRARVGTAAPEETLSQLRIDLPEDVETRIVENTGDVTYLVFPPDPNARLSDESLSGVAGGDCAGTVGCVSSLGCFVSCLGSIGSIGTASCAG